MNHSSTGEKKLILIVDDDWMNREMLQAQLRLGDYEVMEAHSGDQALKLAFARPPDLALLDVRLQDLSGYEVCAQLKNDSRTQHTAVVMVTGLRDEEDRLKADEVGADDFIAKPFAVSTLLEVVETVLRTRSLPDA